MRQQKPLQKPLIDLRQRGISLIETLIVVVLTSFSALAVCELLYLNHAGSYRVSNITDCNSDARIAIERLGRDIREARTLGDVCGQDVQVSGSSPPVYYSSGIASFPSPNNALYGQGGSPGTVPAPTGGWQNPWTEPTYTAPWTISSQMLIVQIPIFDSTNSNPDPGATGPFGCPTEIPANAISAGIPAVNQDNVETHVYQIVPDPDQVNHYNEFDLQLVRIPGYAVSGIYTPSSVAEGPETILTGIIGPMPPGVTANAAGSSSYWPAVFSFLDKTGSGTPTFPPLADSDIPNYTGVVINLEIRKGVSTNPTQPPAYLAFKQEVFMRNNALATTAGQPSNVTTDPYQWTSTPPP